jgi:hypothetical protein
MDFPSNSQTAKPSGEPTGEKKEKVVLKVVEGGAIRRKQPLSSRLKEALFGDDAKAAVHHAIWDIAIPAGRDMVFNAFVEGLRRAAYGENSGPRHSAGNIGTRLVGSALGHTAYDRFAKPGGRVQEPQGMSRIARMQHNFEEVILPSYADADAVLDVMKNMIDHYGMVTVGDLYDMINEPRNHADEKWGWTDLRGSRPRRIGAGYLLDVPRPEPLNIR